MSSGGYFDHFGVFRVFWWFHVYFGHLKAFESILVILVFQRYFGGSEVILIILEILGLFGLSFRFRGYFGVSGVFWSF
jgi:hypothetical protein